MHIWMAAQSLGPGAKYIQRASLSSAGEDSVLEEELSMRALIRLPAPRKASFHRLSLYHVACRESLTLRQTFAGVLKPSVRESSNDAMR